MTGFGSGNLVSTSRKRAHVIFAFFRRRRRALNQINFTPLDFREGFHRTVVTHDAEISVVAAQHLAQPELLLLHWNMYAPFHFHPQRLKFSDHAVWLAFTL